MTRIASISRALLLLSLGAIAAACGTIDDDPAADVELREIVFETSEVADAMQANPDTTFLVDLREGTIVHFDQEDGPIDLSNFMAVCPSMPGPVPMASFIEGLELEEAFEEEYVSLQSTLTPRSEFRIMADGGGDCYEQCNAQGTDCVWVC